MSAIGKLIGEITGSNAQARAAAGAAGTQAAAADAGIAEQRRQFDALQQLLAPYTQAGVPALQAMQALAGLGPEGSQEQAIARITASPEFAAMTQQGEEALLANASATGGLRGGNTQAALAQFRPQVLSQLINQQYSRLGGLTALGQNSAAGVGAAGMQSGDAITALLQQQGAARAGGQLALGGQAYRGFNDGVGLAALYASGGFGGGTGGGQPAMAGGAPAGGGLRIPMGFRF